MSTAAEKQLLLKAFKTQLSKTDYLILDHAISFGRVTFTGVLKWEDTDKKQLIFEVPVVDVLQLFSPLLPPSDQASQVTTPLYPSKLTPGMYRIRLNMKKFPEWQWNNITNKNGAYEVVADVDMYVGYNVGDKQLSGWFLRPVVMSRRW